MSDPAVVQPAETSTPDGAVVVGLDGSEKDELVLRWAADEAVLRKAPLHIVMSREGLSGLGSAAESGIALQEMSRLMDEIDDSGQIVERAREGLATSHPSLTVTTSRPWGTGGQAMIAASEGAVLAVVGTSRKGAAERWVLGTVSLDIAAHGHCPVVVVPLGSVPDTPRNRIVVGLDGSVDSEAALSFALAEARLRGASLDCVATWNVEVVDGVVVTTPGSEGWLAVEKRYRTGVQEMLDARDTTGVEVFISIERGKPALVLADHSQRADLVVTGSRGRGGFKGMVLGSVSHGVMLRAQCPIGIIRPREGAAR